MVDSDDADKPKRTEGEREASHKQEDDERGRQHELEMAELAARHKADLDKQQQEHERELGRHTRAHQAMLAAQQGAQQTAQQNREHKVAWYATVWVPILLAAVGGFLGGLVTLGGKYLERDVRHQVWEATYQDKQRAAQTQSDLMKLQEDYIGKLKQLQENQQQLDDFARQLVEQGQKLAQAHEEYRVALLAMRRRCGSLEAAEKARKAAAKASAEQKERREKWKAYGCRIDWLFYGNGCSIVRATFAVGTPDERIVYPANAVNAAKAVCKGVTPDEDRAALQACEKHATTFLLSKGVSQEDIRAILDAYSSRDAVRKADDAIARPAIGVKVPITVPSLREAMRVNDAAAEKALREKFPDQPDPATK